MVTYVTGGIAILIRLYHNPRCSKSRSAHKILIDKAVDFEDYRYLENGIHPDDLDILSGLNGIIRINDLENNQNIDSSDFAQVKIVLSNNPNVLQRPVLVVGREAVICRPPEKILTLLP